VFYSFFPHGVFPISETGEVIDDISLIQIVSSMTTGESETSPPSPGVVIDDFLIMEQIGSGAFSRVHFAKHISTKNYYAAVKIVEPSKLDGGECK
jgi:serine/threonine protein kinase